MLEATKAALITDSYCPAGSFWVTLLIFCTKCEGKFVPVNNNRLYFRNDNIPKHVRQDKGHEGRWYRHINNHNGSTVFFKFLFVNDFSQLFHQKIHSH